MHPKTYLPLAASLLAFAPLAQAGVVDNPASLLIYPEFDSNPGVLTLITVTNTNSSSNGTVQAHFIFINKDGCGEFNRSETLTPNDTFTFVAGNYNPNAYQGYVYCYARNRVTGKAISWNYLAGIQTTLNGLTQFNYSYNPFNFKALRADGLETDAVAGGAPAGDADGQRDLNGIEYEACPAEILIPNFLGQEGARVSNLVLINLSGVLGLTTATVNFTVFNNEEDNFSAQTTVTCWKKVPLLSINLGFANQFLKDLSDGLLDTAAAGAIPGAHPQVAGAGTLETGWIRLRGSVANQVPGGQLPAPPAILAVLSESVASYQIADLPYGIGTNNSGAIPGFNND